LRQRRGVLVCLHDDDDAGGGGRTAAAAAMLLLLLLRGGSWPAIREPRSRALAYISADRGVLIMLRNLISGQMTNSDVFQKLDLEEGARLIVPARPEPPRRMVRCWITWNRQYDVVRYGQVRVPLCVD
jgi:hypothetical protein